MRNDPQMLIQNVGIPNFRSRKELLSVAKVPQRCNATGGKEKAPAVAGAEVKQGRV
jgi:hypothetical protein